jgi:hypothetical protein
MAMRVILLLIALHGDLVYSFFHAPVHRETWRCTPTSRRIAPRRGRASSAATSSGGDSRKEGYAMRIRHAGPCKTTLRVACLLSAVLCAAADAHHVPSCSGGPGGGVDSTGNQCSAAGHDVDSTPPSESVARPAVTNAATVQHHEPAIGSPSVGHVVPGPHNTAVSQSTHRFAGQVKQTPAESPVGPAKTANTEEGLCSGGAEGGMVATGNKCNPAASVLPVQTSAR